jgi:D-tyrosyl-tRNA(Tyr) deacylase
MRIVLQRVSQASVEIGGKTIGRIGTGLLLLISIEKGDGEKEIAFTADKILNLRVFPDDSDKMNLSVKEIKGEILSISQFTLASRLKKGRRPDFSGAEEPKQAEELYSRFNRLLAAAVPVAMGIFGAMMDVHSVNHGPVTFILEKTAADQER